MSKTLAPTVLVVEDEEDVRRHLVRALRREGCAVDEAGDGPPACERFEAVLHPVVLLDLRLPSLDGLEVLRRIKSLRPESQVVILTGHGGKQDAVKGLNLHAFRFLEKPPDLDAILQAVRDAYDVYLELVGLEATDEDTQGSTPTLEEVRSAMAAVPKDKLDPKGEDE